jgi:hypothetical protein
VLSRIIQHEAGATPPSLLVVAQQLVQAFPLQDGDVLLPQLVSRALALCFGDDDVIGNVSSSENEGGVVTDTAAREEAALMLQMVAALADAVPKGTANQLAHALLQVSHHIYKYLAKKIAPNNKNNDLLCRGCSRAVLHAAASEQQLLCWLLSCARAG